MVSKPVSVSLAAAEVQQEAGSDRAKESPGQGSSRGPRKQLTVTMAAKKVLYFCSFHMHINSYAVQQKPRGGVIVATCSYTLNTNLPLQGKRVVSEKPEKKPVSVDIGCPTDDGQAKRVASPGRGKQPPHVSCRDPLVQVGIRASEHSPSALTLRLIIPLHDADGFLKIDVRHVGWTRPW